MKVDYLSIICCQFSTAGKAVLNRIKAQAG
jgi:hypothetical protein